MVREAVVAAAWRATEGFMGVGFLLEIRLDGRRDLAAAVGAAKLDFGGGERATAADLELIVEGILEASGLRVGGTFWLFLGSSVMVFCFLLRKPSATDFSTSLNISSMAFCMISSFFLSSFAFCSRSSRSERVRPSSPTGLK